MYKKETLAQVFSCVFFEIPKKTFFYRTPPVAASGLANQEMRRRKNLSVWPIVSYLTGIISVIMLF